MSGILKRVSAPVLKDGNKLSTYTGDLTNRNYATQLIRLRKAFKGCDDNWADILEERLKTNNFTDQRLIDAVDNLLDRFKFGHKPNIAEIISFDRTIEVFTYKQILDMLKEDGKTFANYAVVNIEGQPRYVLKEYQEKYHLNLYEMHQPHMQNKCQEISDDERLTTAQIIKNTLEQLRNKSKNGTSNVELSTTTETKPPLNNSHNYTVIPTGGYELNH